MRRQTHHKRIDLTRQVNPVKWSMCHAVAARVEGEGRGLVALGVHGRFLDLSLHTDPRRTIAHAVVVDGRG